MNWYAPHKRYSMRETLHFLSMTPFIGGGEIYLKSLVYGLKNSQDANFFISATVCNTQFAEDLRAYESGRDAKSQIHELTSSSYRYYFKSVRFLLQVLKMHDVTHLHLNGARELYHVPLIKLFRHSLIVTMTQHTDAYSIKGIKGWLRKVLYRFFFCFVDQAVAVSEHIKRQMLKMGLPEKKITVIHNTPRHEFFIDSQYQIKISQNKKLHMVMVGRIEPLKGWRDLAEACYDLEIDVTFIGDICEEVPEKWRQRYAFVGFQKDHREVLRTADVFALPSYAEGCPLSILEAMAMGIPIIATKIDAISELVANDKEALLSPAGDICILKQNIIKYMEQPELRLQLARQAYERVLRDFNPAHWVQKYIQFFNSLKR